jgi:hypothetical protein
MQPVIETVVRIIEDIPPVPEKTIVTEETQQRKHCPNSAKLLLQYQRRRCQNQTLAYELWY